MIEVTDEMINAGTRAWIEHAPAGDPHKAFAATYRAMRALEPKPEPSPKPTIAELDALLNSEDGRPVRILPDGSVRVETPTAAQNVGQFGFASAAYQPAEELAKSAHLWVDRTKPFSALDEIARANRHLDALQALVLVLAARSPGYPPGDATLTRLIAAAENAR